MASEYGVVTTSVVTKNHTGPGGAFDVGVMSADGQLALSIDPD